MAEAGLVYTVRDRSLLLPHYKKFLIEPLIVAIPPTVDPNAITHVGHLINLTGLSVLLVFGVSGTGVRASFCAAIVCLQLYNWCDNALSAVASLVFGTLAFANARDARHRVMRLDSQASRSPLAASSRAA
jgi:hypothetical protein